VGGSPVSWESMLGVDLYTDHGRLRADDLAVRNYASRQLLAAAGALRAVAAAYQRAHIPMPTRENPFPSAADLAPPRAAEALAARFTAAANRLRGASFPDPERVWHRMRQEGNATLVEFDRLLVGHAEIAGAAVGGLTATELPTFVAEAAESALCDVESVLADRETWLYRP
jgi:hypothetical protein